MHRCFIDAAHWTAPAVIPSPSEAHHILNVLRAKDGDRIRIFNGAGKEADARVRRSEGSPHLELEIIERQMAPRCAPGIVLLQAVIKGSRMEMVIEKATELGVAKIVPFLCERTIPRFTPQQAQQKRQRWERIAISAAKQCGTPWLPEVLCPCALPLALQQTMGTTLFGALVCDRRPLPGVIDELRMSPPANISIVIGPEGDLTHDEIDLLRQSDAIPISLGPLTLRAETAAISAISTVGCMLTQGNGQLQDLCVNAPPA